MSILARLVLLTVLSVLLISCEGNSFYEADPGDWFSEYQGKDTPGAAVLVIRDGQTVYRKGFGMAHIENQIEITPETSFRLASLTKQFTAMAIMMLVEDGKLQLDTRITDVFPDLPGFMRDITIVQLVRHNAGLVDYASLVPASATEQVHDSDVFDMMRQTTETLFPPGTSYQYSNSGYAMLAMVVEELSGLSFSEYLATRIFTPLHMDHSVGFVEGVNTVPDRAFGYTVSDSGVDYSDQSLTSAVLGDGGIYSSVDDLARWDQALYTDTLVSSNMLEFAFTPGLSNYGFGWRITDYKGRKRLSHTGSSRGFRNVIHRFPDEKLTVIILTNRSGPDVTPLAEKLTDHFMI